MTTKPLPQAVTIDYWWDRTKAAQGRYRVLMGTGLVLCCLIILSLLALKLLMETIGFIWQVFSSVAEYIPDENDKETETENESKLAQYYRDKEAFGHEFASKLHGLDG